MDLSAIVKVGKRYTIVIPKSIREKLRLKEGSKVLLRISGNRIIIEPLPDSPFEILGKVVGEPYSEEVDEKKAQSWLMRNASS